MRALTLLLVIACGSPKSAPTVANATTPDDESCAATAAELERYLATVWDKTATPTPPWPAGDAETDKVIEDARAKVRKAMAPPDPSQPATKLSRGIPRGPLDVELDKCPAASDSLKRVGMAETDAEKQAGFVGIAPAIGECDCKLNVPLVRAALYLIVRGPD